jgi:5'-3' exoribonuclease 2
MGVPTFFRWLSRKYPKIVVDVVEEEWNELPNGERIPPDTSRPNPNGIEFDCLYLDMNGIIHPCFHPENKPQPESEEEILNAIYEYIDRLFAIVRPRRLLYLAIDGVAPRAKMNQQRSRRFRAVKEALQKAEDEEIVRQDLVARGLLTPQEAQAQRERAARRLDSNIITPGTAFMDHVAQGLRGYIQRRLTSDPGWRGLTVILSDASVPGEGEHKIMQFIRRQRHQPGYDPNTRHVLYGLDADLIMLALATHEPHFHILREVVLMNTTTNCHRCGLPGHHAFECMTVLTAPRNSTLASAPTSQPVAREKRVPYQFLRVNVLREYLAKDLFVETPFLYCYKHSRHSRRGYCDGDVKEKKRRVSSSDN